MKAVNIFGWIDRLKDALLASVSHDLRTPLTTIKALAHDLGSFGDERSQVIEEQADRLNRFVGDLEPAHRMEARENLKSQLGVIARCGGGGVVAPVQ